MRNLFIKTNSPWRRFFPLIRKLRQWSWKFNDRTGVRLVISGGKTGFMDAELNFPEGVGLTYTTPLFWNGPEAYEMATSRTIARLVERCSLFLDVGSNIGIYSVYAGIKFPRVKTFAFEPVPVIWEKNCAFHRANNLPVANILKVALGDRTGSQTIYLPIYQAGLEEEQTGTLLADSWQARHEKVEQIEIQCLTLDVFASQNGLPPGKCCLKIDVENFEAGVLRGGREFIKQRRPWIVCEVLPGQDYDPVTKVGRNNNQETIALAGELGYAIFAISDEGFFRMSPADFDRPRGMKDFLFAPVEKIPAELFYLPLQDLAGMV